MTSMPEYFDREALERYLHEHIPLSAAMALGVRSCSPQRVELAAPLAPNLNHQGTVFGGSASSLAILAAWALLHLRMQDCARDSRIVIQRSTMRFDVPIGGDFSAVCEFDDELAWERFRNSLLRRGRARLALASRLWQGGRTVAAFEGDFVALKAAGHA